jgi:tetratricopeptide (TPR) repeat protein
LEGSVRRAGDKVRVTAQLIRSENGFHVWSQTYDRQVSDIFLIQDEIAAEVVDQLQLLLSADSQKLLERSSRVDPVVYDYYLRGRAYLRNPPDESNLRFAAELFGKAIAANADFAHAYAGQCDALLGLYEIDLETTHFSAAEASCEKALRLDRRAAAVYIALGNLYLTSGQYAQAEEEFKLALSLGSMTAEANLGLGDVYLVEGRYPQARRRYQNALDLQPRYWRALMRMAGFLLETGRVEQAVPYYVTVAELMPDSDLALNNLGVAYFMLGEFEQASAAWRKSLALAPSALTYSNMATVLFMLGNFDEALSLYHQAVELAPESYELWGNLADTYRQLDGGRELAAPMYRNAIKLADKHLEVNAADAEALVLVAHYLAALGERERALGNIGRAKKIAADNMYVSYVEATVHVSLGDDQRALAALETALAAGYPPHMAAADANLGELRHTPGFEALIWRPGVSAAN